MPIVGSLLVTDIAGREIVRSDRHSDVDEWIDLEDYGTGNGGFIMMQPSEWDWFFEIDYKEHGQLLVCQCPRHTRWREPIRRAAGAWLKRYALPFEQRIVPQAAELTDAERAKQTQTVHDILSDPDVQNG